ncbi:MAG TPA: TetR/AcrR family transcriptional regulator, partial [Treponemataceae bacterium]|nr:TetR/AcrR family transcriptional regulator [Treponemataceae bacterium]
RFSTQTRKNPEMTVPISFYGRIILVETESRMERKKRELKQHILEVCERLFVFEKSFENVTMREIARRAEVSVGTLYVYYKTKEDILATILSEFLTRHMQMMRSAVQDKDTGIDKLTAILDYFGEMTADPYVTVFTRIQFSNNAVPKIVKTESFIKTRILLGDLVDLIEDILIAGQNDKTLLLSDSPKVAASVLMRLIISIFQTSGLDQMSVMPLIREPLDSDPVAAFLVLKKYLIRSFKS